MGGSKADDDYLQNSVTQTSSALKYIYMKKRSDKNSTASAVAGIASVINDAISPPASVELKNENEHLIWS